MIVPVRRRTAFAVEQHEQGDLMSPGYENARPQDDKGLRLGGGAIASLSGVALLVIFMLQNRNETTLSFLVWDFTWPLWLVILLSALVGAFVWFGLGVLRRHNRRKARRADR
jgi:uncharacterized integral membrane protein